MVLNTLTGSHAIALTGFRPRLFRVRLSLLFFTSHTVIVPPLLPVAKMCAVLLFQSRQSKSSALATALPILKGFPILFKSEMNSYFNLSCRTSHQDCLPTSPLAPTVASSSGRNALNCSALMAPPCFDVRDLEACLG